MQKHNFFKALTCATLASAIAFTACVNQISEDEIFESTTPITFTAKVNKSNTVTRVTDKAFDEGDEIGLFAMLSGTSISEQRYINNLRLKTGENSTLIPEKEVFYPEGDNPLNFVAYHPYQAGGVPDGSTTMTVSVQTDQSTDEGRTLSDFLVATQTNVASSDKSVTLNFGHKLAKIKIELLPQGDETVDNLLADNPRLTASGFCTQAVYDFSTGTFSEVSEQADIVLAGSWTKGTDKLTGKELIVIPQSTTTGQQNIIMEWNGKIYNCPISSATLETNTQRTIQIKVTESASNTLTGVVGEIQPWQDGENQESENNYQMTAIHTAALSFNTSNIYRIHRNGNVVAEVCKEYLNGEVASRAIVVYPVENDETDLSQGTVLQLLDKTGNVHGGKISWQTESNSFIYQSGSSAPITQFYIDGEGKIATEKPETTSEVNVSNYLLRDIRSSVLQEYAIVKIGTQYWMRQELKATTYRDGTALTQQSVVGKGAGYFVSTNKKMYFYNGEALEEGELAPEGWKIPQKADWSTLTTYAGSAAVLKADTWESSNQNDPTVAPVTNLTDFTAYPVGIWQLEQQGQYQFVGYWTLNDEGTGVAAQTLFLLGDKDEAQSINTKYEGADYYKALSIRCLKE
ncbi:MAG: fimbrillin family protein [Bacteroides sp.]|nr:fimbrillin family protein [Bacteroides sp.]